MLSIKVDETFTVPAVTLGLILLSASPILAVELTSFIATATAPAISKLEKSAFPRAFILSKALSCKAVKPLVPEPFTSAFTKVIA